MRTLRGGRSPILTIVIAVVALVAAACDTTAHPTPPPGLIVAPIGGSPNVPFVTATFTATATTPANCPLATPEDLQVEPVTSPTDKESQVIRLSVGNLESVTITSTAGEFHYTQPPYIVPLPPNSVSVLSVTVKIKSVIEFGHCTYGGYTLSAIHDRNGAPLVIVQQGVTVNDTATITPTGTATKLVTATVTATATTTATATLPTQRPTPTATHGAF